MSDRSWGFATRAVHAGGGPDPTTGARAVPIYQSSSFVFEDTADAASLFALQKYGTIYSRISNPTVAAFEERMASLEGGLGAVATSSGQAAQFLTFAALAGAGDHIVASASLYGGTVTQLNVTLRRFGVQTTFVTGSDPGDYAAAITGRTKLVFAEVLSNPSCEEGTYLLARGDHRDRLVEHFGLGDFVTSRFTSALGRRVKRDGHTQRWSLTDVPHSEVE